VGRHVGDVLQIEGADACCGWRAADGHLDRSATGIHGVSGTRKPRPAVLRLPAHACLSACLLVCVEGTRRVHSADAVLLRWVDGPSGGGGGDNDDDDDDD
jgi:hypothetical protein